MTSMAKTMDREDIWTALAAPLPSGEVQWRQNGRPKARGTDFYAPFVAYIEANTVRERLDAVVPGEWDLTLDLMPPLLSTGGEGEANDTPIAYKARLQVLGVIREDVGAGKDYKQASTDAFKRVAVRFGVGHELYSYEQNWVQMDGDGKYAKPIEDPGVAYERRYGKTRPAKPAIVKSATREATEQCLDMEPVRTTRTEEALARVPKPAAASDDEPVCPKCSGKLWDNRAENDARLARGEKLRPDWKCRDRNCDGVIWRPKGEKVAAAKVEREVEEVLADEEDFLPF